MPIHLRLIFPTTNQVQVYELKTTNAYFIVAGKFYCSFTPMRSVHVAFQYLSERYEEETLSVLSLSYVLKEKQ